MTDLTPTAYVRRGLRLSVQADRKALAKKTLDAMRKVDPPVMGGAVWLLHSEGMELGRWSPWLGAWADEYDPERVVCGEDEVLAWAFQDEMPEGLPPLIYADWLKEAGYAE